DRDLRRVFDLSYDGLPASRQTAFRLLGLIPGQDIDRVAAGALLAADAATTDEIMQDLLDHNLISEPSADRYRMHDLLRAHAATLAAADPLEQRHQALNRLFDHYRDVALGCTDRIARHTRPGASAAGPEPLPADDRAWLRTERANLEAGLKYALDDGDSRRVV